MIEKPLISIIIPVYNGEKYLRQCLNSVLSQTYENWELLLIDDGSTDPSSYICDEYASDSRIIVIHRQNGGQATARNEGIAQS
jgi:glycosyltransferase involved in cell wall biosynthesis